LPANTTIKRTLKIIAVIASSLFLIYLTVVVSLMGGAWVPLPEKSARAINILIGSSVILGLIAIVLSFFPYPKRSLLVFALQCLVFWGVIATHGHLVPTEKEKNLRANYKKINTRVLNDAETLLECQEGYRLALSPSQKTSTGRTTATLNLVSPNLEDEPLQIWSSVNGQSGEIYIKYSHRHLQSILPSCKNEELNFDGLAAKLKSM